MPRSDNSNNIHPRTWVEVSEQAVVNNYRVFREFAGEDVHIWAVVKSNAYGHGIHTFPKLAEKAGYDGFCVDSLAEAITLREQGTELPILIIGPTQPEDMALAAEHDAIVSVATMEDVDALLKTSQAPEFHIKVDTGFHRRGFYLNELKEVVQKLQSNVNGHPSTSLGARRSKVAPTGAYTHFASAKDMNYPAYTDKQLEEFMTAVGVLEEAGFDGLMRHCAATSATIISDKYHLDAVRVGIGMYGLWPSVELSIQRADITLTPALSWRVLVSEVKPIKKGEYVGYNLTERMPHDGHIAVVPIGYWYGLSRNLSHVGEVLIKGKRAKILGKISMDLMVVDVTEIDCNPGGIATIIGKDGQEEIMAQDLALKLNTINYEVVTRINPLIERRVISKQ